MKPRMRRKLTAEIQRLRAEIAYRDSMFEDQPYWQSQFLKQAEVLTTTRDKLRLQELSANAMELAKLHNALTKIANTPEHKVKTQLVSTIDRLHKMAHQQSMLLVEIRSVLRYIAGEIQMVRGADQQIAVLCIKLDQLTHPMRLTAEVETTIKVIQLINDTLKK